MFDLFSVLIFFISLFAADTMGILKELANDEEEVLALIMDMTSDEDSTPSKRKKGGSQRGKRANINRRRGLYSKLLFDDYWGENPVYPPEHFRAVFRMPRNLFDEIVSKVSTHDTYFTQRTDAIGLLGFTPLQKCVASLRLLTSGVSPRELDDKYRMATSTGLKTMQQFCEAVGSIFGDQALRSPTKEDIDRLLDEALVAGWPGCLGSIDCMHWEWKNCPSSWKGMFQGRDHVATVKLEAIADHSRRFWHFYFGCPGALNDLNVLDRSTLHDNACNGITPIVKYIVNGELYTIPYWLADGIYPTHHCFVKTIPFPTNEKEKLFVSKQEEKRKDIECAFGILQARFHILTTPCRLFDRGQMRLIIRTCVILHNLIIDYEKEHALDSTYIGGEQYQPSHPFEIIERSNQELANFGDSDRDHYLEKVRSEYLHSKLQQDLVEHMWETQGNL